MTVIILFDLPELIVSKTLVALTNANSSHTCPQPQEHKLVLFKVANELVGEFENEHNGQVIASGNSIMDVLLEFERVDDPRKGGEMEARPLRYKNDG